MSETKLNWPVWQIFWTDSLLGVIALGLLPFVMLRHSDPKEKLEPIQDYPDTR